MSNIYLIGFMGCGKSTLGVTVSDTWKMQLLDLDEVIVQQQKCTIADIFENHGEEYFRQIESKVLFETTQLQHAIIATGGGIVEKEENRSFLKQQEVVYLKWPFDTLYARVNQDPTRPLAISYEVLKERFDRRQQWYEEVASRVVECEGHTPFTVCEELSVYYKDIRRIIK